MHDAETQISSFFVKSTVTQEIDEYFENKESLSENDMTGIFKDKNLLIIQLESFDKRLLDEEICPNICSLLDDSIYFENYYGILAGDEPTFDNEFAVNTGYYAFSGFNASTEIVDDTFSYSLANAFSKGGGIKLTFITLMIHLFIIEAKLSLPLDMTATKIFKSFRTRIDAGVMITI